MQPPALTNEDVARALALLFPRGAAWPQDSNSVQGKLRQSIAPTYTAIAARDANLIVDTFPATSVELLSEWEASLGLPDACTPLGATIEQRQRAVLAKFIGRGGQSIPYFTAVAAALGYQISVIEGPAPSYEWTVLVHDANHTFFQANINNANDYLENQTDSSEMICRLNVIKPAHTVLNFVDS